MKKKQYTSLQEFSKRFQESFGRKPTTTEEWSFLDGLIKGMNKAKEVIGNIKIK